MRLVRGRKIILRNIDWKTYSRLIVAFNEHRGVRMTYDRGRLEIMCPMLLHERVGDFLGQLILATTEELGLPFAAGGSTTLRRRHLRKGVEPDNCYWIANEPMIRDKDRLDLRVDPPPDIAIEVDITSSSLDRMSIYAELGVPELWRLEGGTALFFHSLAAGSYTIVTHSRSFPFMTPADLMSFVALRRTQGETSVRKQFRAWVRQHAPPTP
jgi:Uma2 family endonuclease